MDITQVADSQGGSLQEATGQRLVVSPVQIAPQARVFRRIFYLRFQTGGAADQISIDEATAFLRAKFLHLDYNALSPPHASLAASLTTSGNLMFVTLDAPRRIRSVRVGATSGVLELYRLDGQIPAEKPTVAACISNNVATLPDNVDFTDTRFAVGVRDSTSVTISQVNVRSYPTTPRVGLMAEGSSPAFFWLAPGEIGKQAPAEQGSVDAGPKLADALQRHLDALTTPLPAQLEVPLVIESDAPCIFEFVGPAPALKVSYHLAIESLGSGEEKETLRFPGGEATAREVSLALPANAAVLSATLEVVESFRPDRTDAAGGDAISREALSQKRGVYLGVERWAGQQISRETAVSVSGVALGLTPLADDTEVVLELQEDWEGRPSGKTLAEASLSLGQAGRPAWTTVVFADPVVLPSRPHWLLVKAARGHAVWLADAAEDSVQALERASAPNVWKQLNVVKGIQAIYRLFSRTESAQEQTPPFTLSLGGTLVEPAAANRPDARSFDLTSALNSFLDAQPPDSIGATVPLSFQAATQGFLTVYPPRITYDVPV